MLAFGFSRGRNRVRIIKVAYEPWKTSPSCFVRNRFQLSERLLSSMLTLHEKKKTLFT